MNIHIHPLGTFRLPIYINHLRWPSYFYKDKVLESQISRLEILSICYHIATKGESLWGLCDLCVSLHAHFLDIVGKLFQIMKRKIWGKDKHCNMFFVINGNTCSFPIWICIQHVIWLILLLFDLTIFRGRSLFIYFWLWLSVGIKIRCRQGRLLEWSAGIYIRLKTLPQPMRRLGVLFLPYSLEPTTWWIISHLGLRISYPSIGLSFSVWWCWLHGVWPRFSSEFSQENLGTTGPFSNIPQRMDWGLTRSSMGGCWN